MKIQERKDGIRREKTVRNNHWFSQSVGGRQRHRFSFDVGSLGGMRTVRGQRS